MSTAKTITREFLVVETIEELRALTVDAVVTDRTFSEFYTRIGPDEWITFDYAHELGPETYTDEAIWNLTATCPEHRRYFHGPEEVIVVHENPEFKAQGRMT